MFWNLGNMNRGQEMFKINLFYWYKRWRNILDMKCLKIDHAVIRGGEKKSYPISIIRLVSLLLIISCHMLQFYHVELAWWLNVGVQVFLCISGFLYGNRQTPKPIDFYRHRFVKILIPYYIVFCTAGLLQFLFFPDKFSFLHFGAGLFCRATITGGGHLWFVKIILLCYVLTPLLGIYRDRFIVDKKSLFYYLVSGIAVVSIILSLFAQSLNPAWVSCYIIGYCIGENEKEKYVNTKLLLFIFFFLATIGNSIQIYIDYVKNMSFAGYKGIIYTYFQDYNHVMLGVFLFLLMKLLFEKINFNKIDKQVLDICDEYSYEIYLVHQFLILGPFTIMAITDVPLFNVVIVLIGVILLALALNKSVKMLYFFHSRYKKGINANGCK